MIVDAFLYAGEQDMCELRMRTLAPVVDVFVPVMCTLTHQGEPTAVPPLPDVDVPVAPYVVNPEPIPDGSRGGVGSRWYQFIERQHRDGIRRACDLCSVVRVHDDAVVLVSDVDEIPHPDAVLVAARLIRAGGWVVFEQRFHSTYLQWLHPQQPWLGTTATLARDLAPQQMRDRRGDATVMLPIPTGGWHLSWFGSDAQRARKLATFSHAELRGRFDPQAGRARREHANGERLQPLSLEQLGRFDWPAPAVDGSFRVPDSWIDLEVPRLPRWVAQQAGRPRFGLSA